MKNKTILSLAVASALVSVTANAATIAVGRGTGNPGITAMTSENTALSTGGYYIATGTFATEPVITTDFSSLLSAVASFQVFQQLSSPTSGATVGTIVGSFVATGAAHGGTTAADFNLKSIYFLVGNASTKAASTEWAIFKPAGAQSFPANVAATTTVTVTLSGGAAATPLANAGTITGNNLKLVADAVPEPSAALLGAIGALGLLRRRRN